MLKDKRNGDPGHTAMLPHAMAPSDSIKLE